MSSRRCSSVAPTGFSLVELLVSISIIGMLVGLLLPAIQAARENARRMSCLNNLHQIGIGMLAFHDANKHFPQGCVDRSSRRLAWSAYLLPFVDQGSLAKQIDFQQAYYSADNAAAAAQVLPVYLCPSYPRGTYLVRGRGACDYGGINGERITSTTANTPPKGVMLNDQDVCIRDIIDGASHTLMIGEDSGWSDGQWINGLNIFDQAYAINHAPSIENDMRSRHRGGANGLFADGSVRFLTEEMDLTILAAVCTRNGREIIGDF